jgi:hypothetical protein
VRASTVRGAAVCALSTKPDQSTLSVSDGSRKTMHLRIALITRCTICSPVATGGACTKAFRV